MSIDTNTNPQVSEIFGPSYGDFVTQSSDGVLFYFPRYLLSYVSPVFKDMFDLGQVESNKFHQNTPVVISEDSNIWTIFLSHIDPLKDTPPLDVQTIIHVLAVAEKYQVVPIITWFAREAVLTKVSCIDNSVQSTLLHNHPLLIFALARRHNLPDLARYALRELMKCDISLITAYRYPAVQELPYILGLRQERVAWFCQWIVGVLSGVYDSTSPRTSRPSRCDRCLHVRAIWIGEMTQSVFSTPNWASFSAKFHRGAWCCIRWGEVYATQFNAKKEDTEILEQQLPLLPK